MNEKECLFLCCSLWSLFHLIFEDCRVDTDACGLFILLQVQFPFSGNTLIKAKDGGGGCEFNIVSHKYDNHFKGRDSGNRCAKCLICVCDTMFPTERLS